MRIANPLYDVVFKYLMEDNNIAKLMISKIIGEEILSLECKPQENTVHLPERSLTVYRLDFAAKLKTPQGPKTVLIEIQKAKFSSDLMRFRRYLGEQYKKPDNLYKTANGDQIPTPLITIYFLGYPLESTQAPVLKVNRQVHDLTTGAVVERKETFIESLTHDCYVIQVPYIRHPYASDLQAMLAVFDQHNRTEDFHILNVNESDFPETYRPLIRRLQQAYADQQVLDTMTIEDEVLEELQQRERLIAGQQKALAEKDQALAAKDQALTEKDQALAEQAKLIEQLKQQLSGRE